MAAQPREEESHQRSWTNYRNEIRTSVLPFLAVLIYSRLASSLREEEKQCSLGHMLALSERHTTENPLGSFFTVIRKGCLSFYINSPEKRDSDVRECWPGEDTNPAEICHSWAHQPVERGAGILMPALASGYCTGPVKGVACFPSKGLRQNRFRTCGTSLGLIIMLRL